MDLKTAIRCAAELAALRFFPVGPEGLKAVAKKLAEFCSEENVPIIHPFAFLSAFCRASQGRAPFSGMRTFGRIGDPPS